jgi:hypothetical protein
VRLCWILSKLFVVLQYALPYLTGWFLFDNFRSQFLYVKGEKFSEVRPVCFFWQCGMQPLKLINRDEDISLYFLLLTIQWPDNSTPKPQAYSGVNPELVFTNSIFSCWPYSDQITVRHITASSEVSQAVVFTNRVFACWPYSDQITVHPNQRLTQVWTQSSYSQTVFSPADHTVAS